MVQIFKMMKSAVTGTAAETWRSTGRSICRDMQPPRERKSPPQRPFFERQQWSGGHGLRRVLVLVDLVEVHVLVDLVARRVEHAHVGLVLGHGREAAELGAIAASSAEPRYTLVFLPRRLGKLRVLVETTVAPSRTCAWLPMHRLQPGISVRAPAAPNTP